MLLLSYIFTYCWLDPSLGSGPSFLQAAGRCLKNWICLNRKRVGFLLDFIIVSNDDDDDDGDDDDDDDDDDSYNDDDDNDKTIGSLSNYDDDDNFIKQYI